MTLLRDVLFVGIYASRNIAYLGKSEIGRLPVIQPIVSPETVDTSLSAAAIGR